MHTIRAIQSRLGFYLFLFGTYTPDSANGNALVHELVRIDGPIYHGTRFLFEDQKLVQESWANGIYDHSIRLYF